MLGTNARRLAVASLTEAGDAATALWRRDGRPLQGYVLVTGEGTDCRVTVYLQQGEWSPTAVLAGDMVWFQAPAVGAGEEPGGPGQEAGDAETGGAGASAPGPGGASAGPGAENGPEPCPPPEDQAKVGFKLYPEPATPVSAIPAHRIEVIVTPVAEAPGAGPGRGAPAEAPGDPAESGNAPEEAPDDPAEAGIAPEESPDTPGDSSKPPDAPTQAAATPAEPPAAPAASANGTPVPLLSRHPLAPRAWGSARIHPDHGSLTIALRGLPAASQLDPSANAYRAWLLNQRAGTREPLGLLTRAWGDNYRLETAGDLPLASFDAIIITAEDRRATTTHQNPPQVLFGAYR